MASIRKRGSTWQAQVRREGYPALTKSFPTKAEAAAWSRDKERSMDRADLTIALPKHRKVTVGDLLQRYSETVTPAKRGHEAERYHLRALRSHRLSQTALGKLSAASVVQSRDDRVKLVKPANLRRELAILRRCIEVARKDWGFTLFASPVEQVRLPEAPRGRDRRLEADHYAALFTGITPFRKCCTTSMGEVEKTGRDCLICTCTTYITRQSAGSLKWAYQRPKLR